MLVPCLLTDRAHYVLNDDIYLCLSSVPVACCSHRGLEYPRPHSIGSGSTASTTLSQSSSSSGRGSLPPVGYPGNQLQGMETSPAVCSTPEAVTENELNNHHLHQHRHHLHRNFEQWKVHHPLSEFVFTVLCHLVVAPGTTQWKTALHALRLISITNGQYDIVFSPRICSYLAPILYIDLHMFSQCVE